MHAVLAAGHGPFLHVGQRLPGDPEMAAAADFVLDPDERRDAVLAGEQPVVARERLAVDAADVRPDVPPSAARSPS